ncbi:MAG: hypothetical protein ACRCWI_05355 [Brevinema sp.]
MNRVLLITIGILLFQNVSYTEQQVTYSALEGVWSYFHITSDFFTSDKLIATEQRLFFQDKENVVLNVVAKEKDYLQDTTYRLRYSLSLRDNVPYLSLFSAESTQVLGAYLRMPYKNSLEMAADPGFTMQKQLYQRKDFEVYQGKTMNQNSATTLNN